jgi:Cu-Zn family superoxide dismutase
MEGVAVYDKNIKGFVVFTQRGKFVKISVNVSGLKPRFKHAFHIHETGDLRRGCDSCCKHYNPDDNDHGDIDDEDSHAGDLGNIETDDYGVCIMELKTDKFYVDEIIGRSIIIHEDTEDLGNGNNKDSKTTGNSGKRIACAVIGYSEKSKC